MTAGFLSGLMIVALADDSRAVDCPYSDESALVYWEGVWGPDFSSHDFFVGMVAAERLGHPGLLYEVPLFTLVPIFSDRNEEGNPRRYNLRWASSAAAFFLSRWIDPPEEGGRSSDADHLQVVTGPLSYFLHAPNFTLKACLTKNFRLTAGTRSDVLPYRHGWGERGVLFTPKIGLELSGGHLKQTDTMGRISAEVGYGQWWNFDGPDRTTGWRALVFVTANILR